MDKAKIFRIILMVLIIVSLALAAGVFVLFQKEHANNLELQTQLEDVKAKQEKAQTQLARSRKEISDLEAKLRETQDNIDTLTSDLQKEKDAKLAALKEMDELKSDIASQKEAKAALEKELAQAQDDLNKAQAQLKKLSSQKTDLEQSIKELEVKAQEPNTSTQTGVELGKIIVSPDIAKQVEAVQQTEVTATAAQPGAEAKLSFAHRLEGKVLVINKDYNFAVINLGSNNGVELDDIFSIYRNDNYLGDVKIEKVHDSMSAAGFVSAGLREKISEGDKAILKNK